jgi:hypothetical protein
VNTIQVIKKKETQKREEKMTKPEETEVVSNKITTPKPEVICTETSAYKNEIVETINMYQEKLKDQSIDKNKIKNRLKLLQMKEKVFETKNLPEIEKELWNMAVDIEEPTARMQRNISLVIILYTLVAFASFILLTVTHAIMLPSFNIPYSVLLMGLIGSLVSMYVKLPNSRAREEISYDSMLWFIISPPVSVIMAGICFGIVQIFLPVFDVKFSDESWFFWILAWVVGFVNWVYLYERLNRGLKKGPIKFGKSTHKTRILKPDSTEDKTNNVAGV